MIKILFLIDELGAGGAQSHLRRLISCMNREVFDAKVVTLEELGIKRIYGISGLKGMLRLVKLIKKEGFHIVHSFLFSENILGAIAAKLAGVRVIVTSRRDTGMLREGRLRHILAYRLTNRFVDKILCVSNAVRKIVLEKEKVNPEKLNVIYNGVDANRFSLRNKSDIKSGESTVGMIANFSWIKGHKDFIKAAELVLKEMPNVKFLLIGDGLLRNTIYATVRDRGLQDRVCFLGKRKDITELLSQMDISVNASYSEGMSNAVLESMAAGVPVIATRVDGNLETVIDGETGILVPPKDPQVMARAIIKLLNNKKLAEEMGESGKRLIKERFTSEIMINNMERLYLDLLKPKIAFILSQFPETHETFILREFKAMFEAGFNFSIFSLKQCRDKVIHGDAKALMSQTVYAKAISPQSIVYGVLHPARTLKTLIYVISLYFKNPKELVKGIYVWVECLGLADTLTKSKISHIHSHWATIPTTAAMMLSKLTGIPFSFTAHAWDIFVSRNGISDKIKKAEFVVTCTDYNRKYLEDLVGQRGKIYLNYHGLETSWFEIAANRVQPPRLNRGSTGAVERGSRNDGVKLLAIGRLVEQKGFEYLIEACVILRDKGCDFELNIVGEGSLEKKYSAQISKHKLREKVRLLGIKSQEEIKELYKKADIFVAPSVIAKNKDRDGIPNVMLEAMATGLAAVGTGVSGLPEALKDGETGLVVPERDARALSEAIQGLIGDRELRVRLGQNAKKFVQEKFDLNKNVKNLIRIFGKSTEIASAPAAPRNDGGKKKRSRNDRRTKILYVIWSLEPGGAERVVVDLATHIDKDRFEPYVCCLNHPGKMSDELIESGIPMFYLGKRDKIDLGMLWRLVLLIRKYKFDIIHSHMFTANLWARLAGILAGKKPLIITEHNVDEWKGKKELLVDRVLLPFTKRVIFVSDKVKAFYENKLKIKKSKIVVSRNGIDVSRLSVGASRDEVRKTLGVPNDTILIGAVGRLVPQKDFPNLLHALASVKRTRNYIDTIIAGDGPERENLVVLRDKLGLTKAVKFLGIRRDMADLYNAMDILVVSSEREGLSIAILEAMAMGVPVVATDVGGNAECIVDGVTGLLVTPNNPEILAKAILDVINDTRKMRAMGQEAKNLFEIKFKIRRMIHEHERVYNA